MVAGIVRENSAVRASNEPGQEPVAVTRELPGREEPGCSDTYRAATRRSRRSTMRNTTSLPNNRIADTRPAEPRAGQPNPQERAVVSWTPENPKMTREEVQRIVVEMLG